MTGYHGETEFFFRWIEDRILYKISKKSPPVLLVSHLTPNDCVTTDRQNESRGIAIYIDNRFANFRSNRCKSITYKSQTEQLHCVHVSFLRRYRVLGVLFLDRKRSRGVESW